VSIVIHIFGQTERLRLVEVARHTILCSTFIRGAKGINVREQVPPKSSVGILKKAFDTIVRRAMGTIMNVKTSEPVVALTFDDGPDPVYTPQLLEILGKYGVQCTFFLTGEAAVRHPDIVKRIADGGHAIGNHSWDHPSFPLISASERRAQIRKCAKALEPYGAKIFRPPYADQNLASRLDALLLGYQVVTYDVATDDWCGGTAATIAGQIEQKIHPGCVIVLHDRLFDALEKAHFDRISVLEAVNIILSRLSGLYRFVTVPELLRLGKAGKTIWDKRPDLAVLNRVRRQEARARRY
jgi:peptidoglycan/xylan/chitin deacetylase (PgdA/CDA1 family)